MCAYECWTIKKAKHLRIDAFELLCWRKLLSPLDSKETKVVNSKGNQPWMFIGWTEAVAEAPILWPPDAKSWSLEKTLMLGKTKGKRRRGQQRMRRLDSITDSTDMNQRKLREIVKDRWGRCAAVHGVIKSRTQPSDSTTTTNHKDAIIFLHKTTFTSIHDKWLLLLNLWGLSSVP